MCNKEIDNSNVHILTNEEHQVFLEEAVMSNTEDESLKDITNIACVRVTNEDFRDKIVDSKLDTTLIEDINNTGLELICDICETMLPSCSIDQYIQNNNRKHRHRINKKIKNLEVHYMTEVISKSDLKCKICVCLLERNSKIVENHMKSEVHAENYRYLLSENNIVNTNKYKFHCNFCNAAVSKMYEIKHILDSKHITNMKKALKEIEDITTNNPPHSGGSDINTLCAESSLFKYNETQNADDFKMDQNKTIGFKHMSDRIEITNVINSDKRSSINSDISDTMSYPTHLLEKTANQKQVTCIVCEVSFPSDRNSVLTHFQGKKHMKKIKKLNDIC